MCAGLEASAQWTAPLRIPGTLTGTPVGNVREYNLTMDSTSYVFFPGGDSIPTYSFNNYGLLGPTIIWNTGDSVRMNVMNNLTQTTTVHWHGAHVPARADGGPHEMIMAGMMWSPSFEILDKATTMWYHPHLHEHTLEQVQKGLAGMIIIQDPNDPFQAQLPSTYGVDDIPLIFQDKAFMIQSGDSVISDTCSMGPVLLVNGTYEPVLHVPAQMVRFRMLNGASERVFALAYNDSTTYNIIATDGGYTAAPIPQNNPMMLSSGERVEWVTDFSARQGDTLYIKNYPYSLGKGVPGKKGNNPRCYPDGVIDSVNVNLLKIVVDAPTTAPVTSIPLAFDPLVIPGVADVDVNRTKRLVRYNPNPNPNVPPFTIDSTDFDMDVINDTIFLNDTEMWSIINTTGVAHPFHIHDIHFFIHDINGDTVLPAHLQGPKDVVLVEAGDTVRFITQFTDFATPIQAEDAYMYHCHILSHEDGGMMHQFVVVDPAAVGIDKAAVKEAWRLYPNPASSSVTIEGESASASTINIFDSKGSLVKSVAVPAFKGTHVLNVENLAAGLWLVQWTTAAGSTSHRLIID